MYSAPFLSSTSENYTQRKNNGIENNYEAIFNFKRNLSFI
jgi:hypothetical protein